MKATECRSCGKPRGDWPPERRTQANTQTCCDACSTQLRRARSKRAGIAWRERHRGHKRPPCCPAHDPAPVPVPSPHHGRRKVATTAYVDTEKYAELEKVRERTGISIAELVREGIDLVLANPPTWGLP